jgi:hypothetical protein
MVSMTNHSYSREVIRGETTFENLMFDYCFYLTNGQYLLLYNVNGSWGRNY